MSRPTASHDVIEIIFAPRHLSASVEAGQDIVNNYNGEITAGDKSSVVSKGSINNTASKIRLSGRFVALHMHMGCSDVTNQREWRIGLVMTPPGIDI